MAPVNYHPQEEALTSRQGEYTLRAVSEEVVAQCQGPCTATAEQINYFNGLKESREIPVTAYKVWDHSISPYQEHTECMHNHLLVTYNIPAAECQMVQRNPECRTVVPEASIGHIPVR